MASIPRPSATRGRPLRGLSDRLPGARLHGAPETLVSGITHDSRDVRPGDLYLARPGEHAHGIDYVDAAVASGAVAVLTDPPSVAVASAAGVGAVGGVSDP